MEENSFIITEQTDLLKDEFIFLFIYRMTKWNLLPDDVINKISI